MAGSELPAQVPPPPSRAELITVGVEVHDLCQLPGVLERFREQCRPCVELQRKRVAEHKRRSQANFDSLKRKEGNIDFFDDWNDGASPWYVGEAWGLHLYYGALAIIHDTYIEEIRKQRTELVQLIVSEVAGFELLDQFLWTALARTDIARLESSVVDKARDVVRNDLIAQRMVAVSQSLAEANRDAIKPSPVAVSNLVDDAWLSPGDIAKHFPKITIGALGKRLSRWRSKNSEGWREVNDRKPRESQFLYRWGDVKSLFLPSG